MPQRPRKSRWRGLIAQPGVTAPIASATTLEQLEELIAGVELVLDGESLRTLDAASAIG